MNNHKLAALLIDFDNIYFSLTNQYNIKPSDAQAKVIRIIGNTLSHLNNSLDLSPIIRKAIADWSMYPDIQNELYTMGVKPEHVKATVGKNSADIELSLSALEIMLTRSDIKTLIVLAGDRDYLPIVWRIQEMGNQIMFYSFERCLSGDIKKLVGNENYWYIDPEGADILDRDTTISIAEEEYRDMEEEGGILSSLNEDQIKAIHAAIEAENEYGPIYGSVRLSGFLTDKLAKALPGKSHLERKDIFNSLVEDGLINLSEAGSPLEGTFTVFIINQGHPIVKNEMEKYDNENQE